MGYGIYSSHELSNYQKHYSKKCPLDGIVIEDDETIENCIAYGNGYNGFELNNNCTLKNCLSYDNGGIWILVMKVTVHT